VLLNQRVHLLFLLSRKFYFVVLLALCEYSFGRMCVVYLGQKDIKGILYFCIILYELVLQWLLILLGVATSIFMPVYSLVDSLEDWGHVL